MVISRIGEICHAVKSINVFSLHANEEASAGFCDYSYLGHGALMLSRIHCESLAISSHFCKFRVGCCNGRGCRICWCSPRICGDWFRCEMGDNRCCLCCLGFCVCCHSYVCCGVWYSCAEYVLCCGWVCNHGSVWSETGWVLIGWAGTYGWFDIPHELGYSSRGRRCEGYKGL